MKWVIGEGVCTSDRFPDQKNNLWRKVRVPKIHLFFAVKSKKHPKKSDGEEPKINSSERNSLEIFLRLKKIIKKSMEKNRMGDWRGGCAPRTWRGRRCGPRRGRWRRQTVEDRKPVREMKIADCRILLTLRSNVAPFKKPRLKYFVLPLLCTLASELGINF